MPLYHLSRLRGPVGTMEIPAAVTTTHGKASATTVTVKESPPMGTLNRGSVAVPNAVDALATPLSAELDAFPRDSSAWFREVAVRRGQFSGLHARTPHLIPSRIPKGTRSGLVLGPSGRSDHTSGHGSGDLG
jgi:hypothetical protein